MSKETLMLTIAVLGGTGKEGKGLAYRWAKAGYRILIGSRYSEKAVTVASEIMELLEGESSIVGTTNHEAATQADIVVLTVPYSGHREFLESLKDLNISALHFRTCWIKYKKILENYIIS